MTRGLTSGKLQALARAGYYPILDALRFVLAFCVVVGHFKMIPLFGDPNTGLAYWRLFKHFWATLVFGVPAVIVFFVISGFCIHMPLRGTHHFDVPRYYLRRYTRILIPVAAALVVYKLSGRHTALLGKNSVLWHSPLWSLLCEEIYYALYPLLRWLRNRIGWGILLTIAFPVSVSISAIHPRAADWQDFGPAGTAMILLPVWLMGCLLAEKAEQLTSESQFSSIWLWRTLAWLGSWAAEMMHFKMHISFASTMLWFGVLAYFWLRQEIAHAKTCAPNRYLVAAGAWSYSLYLVHADAGGVAAKLHWAGGEGLLNWFLIMGSSLLFSYLFYVVVEGPSHKLARRITVRGARNASDLRKSPRTIADIAVPSGESLVKEPLRS